MDGRFSAEAGRGSGMSERGESHERMPVRCSMSGRGEAQERMPEGGAA